MFISALQRDMTQKRCEVRMGQADRLENILPMSSLNDLRERWSINVSNVSEDNSDHDNPEDAHGVGPEDLSTSKLRLPKKRLLNSLNNHGDHSNHNGSMETEDQPSEPPASKIMKQPEVNGAETASTSGSGPSPSDTKTIAVVKPSNFLTSVTSVTSMSTASMRSNVASGNHNNKHETAVSDNNNDKLQINTPCEKQTQNDDIGEDLTTKSKSEAAATSTEESCEVKLTTAEPITSTTSMMASPESSSNAVVTGAANSDDEVARVTPEKVPTPPAKVEDKVSVTSVPKTKADEASLIKLQKRDEDAENPDTDHATSTASSKVDAVTIIHTRKPKMPAASTVTSAESPPTGSEPLAVKQPPITVSDKLFPPASMTTSHISEAVAESAAVAVATTDASLPPAVSSKNGGLNKKRKRPSSPETGTNNSAGTEPTATRICQELPRCNWLEEKILKRNQATNEKTAALWWQNKEKPNNSETASQLTQAEKVAAASIVSLASAVVAAASTASTAASPASSAAIARSAGITSGSGLAPHVSPLIVAGEYAEAAEADLSMVADQHTIHKKTVESLRSDGSPTSAASGASLSEALLRAGESVNATIPAAEMIVTLGEDGTNSINPTFKYEYMSKNLCMRLDKTAANNSLPPATSEIVTASGRVPHNPNAVATASLPYLGQHDLYEIDRKRKFLLDEVAGITKRKYEEMEAVRRMEERKEALLKEIAISQDRIEKQRILINQLEKDIIMKSRLNQQQSSSQQPSHHFGSGGQYNPPQHQQHYGASGSLYGGSSSSHQAPPYPGLGGQRSSYGGSSFNGSGSSSHHTSNIRSHTTSHLLGDQQQHHLRQQQQQQQQHQAHAHHHQQQQQAAAHYHAFNGVHQQYQPPAHHGATGSQYTGSHRGGHDLGGAGGHLSGGHLSGGQMISHPPKLQQHPSSSSGRHQQLQPPPHHNRKYDLAAAISAGSNHPASAASSAWGGMGKSAGGHVAPAAHMQQRTTIAGPIMSAAAAVQDHEAPVARAIRKEVEPFAASASAGSLTSASSSLAQARSAMAAVAAASASQSSASARPPASTTSSTTSGSGSVPTSSSSTSGAPPPVNGSLDISCKGCKKDANFMCSACKSVHYCSMDCQRRHWPEHSRQCLSKQQQQKRPVL